MGYSKQRKSIASILSMLANEAMIMPPVTDEELKQCLIKLAMKELPLLPDDYISFLRRCNGFVWVVQFFGTNLIPDTGGCPTDDIVNANTKFKKDSSYVYLNHCLYISRAFNSHFYYDTKKRNYRAWDFNAGLWDDYETFEALFVTEAERELL